MKNFIHFALLACFFCVNSIRAVESIAFYYAPIDSVRELINYDRVVVEPSYISASQIRTLHKAGTRVFAYISIGEFSKGILPRKLSSFKRVKNKLWKSDVMDLSAKAWQEYLYENANGLMDRAFDGLFLDTLDSYQLFSKNKVDKARQEDSLVKIIKKIDKMVAGKSSNNIRLILNRGFEIIPRLTSSHYAVVAESLYHQYSPIGQIYSSVKKKDTEWLSSQLDKIRNKNTEVVVIEYIQENNREGQRSAARKLLELGYTPYVSDGKLSTFGISSIEPIAKRVLGFYDSRIADLPISKCHRIFSMPIEYLGFVPECKDINTTNFASIDVSRYAAVYFWFDSTVYEKHNALLNFVDSLVNRVPILFIGDMPQSGRIMKKLGMTISGVLGKQITVVSGKQHFVRGIPRFSPFQSYPRWKINKDKGIALVSLADEENRRSDIFIQAKWGSAVFAPLPIVALANLERVNKWLIEPFKLLQQVVALPAIPAADVTTESGRRIMTSHIDGDGFPSRALFSGRPYASEVILENILKKHLIPQTVSVVEGEISQQGLYPEQSPQLESIAKKMFKLPHVEVASHTFSHPFYWNKNVALSSKLYGDHLAIPNYTLDYQRETIGSVEYINKRLLTDGKKVKVVLWSGAANPTEEVIEIVERAELLNVNGGGAHIISMEEEGVWPTILWYPNAVQVYAPTSNENVYTNLWTEHFGGYRRVIETFQLLDKPRRLKPISLYYHMYSGIYPASLESLEMVYDWASKQKVNNLYLSEYALRARSLYETGIAKTLDGDWQITSTGVRSIRLPHSFGFPNTRRSSIFGWQDGHDGIYVSLPLGKSIISLDSGLDANHDSPLKGLENKVSEKMVRLSNANAQVLMWKRVGNEIKWQFESHLPLEFEIADLGGCKVESKTTSTIQMTVLRKNLHQFKTHHVGLVEGKIICPHRLEASLD